MIVLILNLKYYGDYITSSTYTWLHRFISPSQVSAAFPSNMLGIARHFAPPSGLTTKYGADGNDINNSRFLPIVYR